MPLDPGDEAFLREARVARLATADEDGRPHVVPICFAFDGERIYTAVDDKPKEAPARRLKRVRNVEANPRVALLVDEYHEDWSRLRFLLVHGRAALVSGTEEKGRAARLLKAKYPQYADTDLDAPRRVVICIEPVGAYGWRASQSTG